MPGTRSGAVGLRRDALHRWLQSAVGGGFAEPSWVAEPLTGGLSDLTYRLRFATESVILRRPIAGVVPLLVDRGLLRRGRTYGSRLAI